MAAITQRLLPMAEAMRPVRRARVIAIGAGEGSTEALLQFFRSDRLPSQPILIVQRNLPGTFARHLSHMITQAAGRACSEALHGELLQDGFIRIAPAGRHLGLCGSDLGLSTVLLGGEKVNGCSPAIDPLFESLAATCGAESLGVILSGRSRDGCDGARRIAAAGGLVVIEEPSSAAQPAMPRHIAAARLATGEARAEDLCAFIRGLLSTHATSRNPSFTVGSRDAVDVLAIAASTGGPAALMDLLDSLSPDFAAPILIVQHMPPNFPRRLAASLAAVTGRNIAEAAPDSPVSPGTVMIAPGDRHMRVMGTAGKIRVVTDFAPPVDFNRPSADVLFESVADVYGPGAVAIVLSGTGQDGLRGSRAIVESGGVVFAQSQASSAAWGMPGAVARAGLATAVEAPVMLARLLTDIASRRDPRAL